MQRILIADDNEFLRKGLKEMLSENAAWSVCGEAADGDEAIGLAAELKPDLVILDFKMPRVDGLRAAAQILKLMPRMPIVLYTLHRNEQLQWAAQKAGISRVVSKYENAEALLECVAELLAPAGEPAVLPPPKPVEATLLAGKAVAKNPKRIPKRRAAD